VTDVYFNLLADGRIRHRNANANLGGWETDAYILALTYPEGGGPQKPKRWFVADGSYLRRDGRVELDSLSKAFVVKTTGGRASRSASTASPSTRSAWPATARDRSRSPAWPRPASATSRSRAEPARAALRRFQAPFRRTTKLANAFQD
jgi:hypothetical protein